MITSGSLGPADVAAIADAIHKAVAEEREALVLLVRGELAKFPIEAREHPAVWHNGGGRLACCEIEKALRDRGKQEQQSKAGEPSV